MCVAVVGTRQPGLSTGEHSINSRASGLLDIYVLIVRREHRFRSLSCHLALGTCALGVSYSFS